MNQGTLFQEDYNKLSEKYKYALLLSGVGDSLGWPLEFSRHRPQAPLESFVKWNKIVGGKWWGYKDEINPGEYSDDTQLMLSVARSIDSSGSFNPEYFAYLELPLWLNYERGGGRSLKAAARNILKRKSKWFTNFYKTQDVNYSTAGANGASMRNLPIALVNINNHKKFVNDSFKNSVVTHGHPRGIIGTIVIGAAQIYFLKNNKINLHDLTEYILDLLNSSISTIKEEKELNSWLNFQNKNSGFENIYLITIKEVEYFLKNIERHLSHEYTEYYTFTGALDKKYKSSGISTSVVAIYLAIKYLEKPEIALFQSASMVGSDTDTIANFVGSLLGAFHGAGVRSQKLDNLISLLQDNGYFHNVANFLWQINFAKRNLKEEKSVNKTVALLNILAWEIGLHEMFWEALKQGDIVVHPTLGRGVIQGKIEGNLRREDYIVKIIKIKFDIGQIAYFHSRVSKEGLVSQSMAGEVEKALI